MAPTLLEIPLIPVSLVILAVLLAATLMELALPAKLDSVSAMAPVQYATAASTPQEESQLALTAMPTVLYAQTRLENAPNAQADLPPPTRHAPSALTIPSPTELAPVSAVTKPVWSASQTTEHVSVALLVLKSTASPVTYASTIPSPLEVMRVVRPATSTALPATTLMELASPVSQDLASITELVLSAQLVLSLMEQLSARTAAQPVLPAALSMVHARPALLVLNLTILPVQLVAPTHSTLTVQESAKTAPVARTVTLQQDSAPSAMTVLVLATILVLPVLQTNSPTIQPSSAMLAQLPARLVFLQLITVLVANLALASKTVPAPNASMEPPLTAFCPAKTVAPLTAQHAPTTTPVPTVCLDSPSSATIPANLAP